MKEKWGINPICLESMEQDLQRRYYREVEARLVRALERIEGRVPTNEEVRRYGRKYLFPDGRAVWTYKNVPLFQCVWWPRPGIAFEITAVQEPVPQ